MAAARNRDSADISEINKDLYNGHKVVAMPSSAFGGMTVRDVVSSRNTVDYRASSISHRRSRSRSIGRSSGSRSRDIVQDVYDRMGVNYTRGRPSIENLIQDNKDLASQPTSKEIPRPTSRGRSTTRYDEPHQKNSSSGIPSRGRNNYVQDEAERRARSLSRGRMEARWQNRSTGIGNISTESLNPKAVVTPEQVEMTILPTTSPSVKKDREFFPHKRRSMPAYHIPTKATQVDRKPPTRTAEENDEERQDTGTQHDEDTDARSTVSVKDRISAFGTPTRAPPSARSVRRSYNAQFPKKEQHPPRMDIYAADPQVEKEVIAPSPSIDASDNLPQKNQIVESKQRFSSANSISNRSRKSGVANAFLAAITPSTKPASPRVSKNIQIVEIPSDEFHGGVESASLAASSVSGEEEFSPENGSHKRSVSKCDRLPRTVISKKYGLNNEKIEKMIEERVCSQVKSIEQKFELKLKQIESRMQEKYEGRINELERKAEKVNSILSKLLSRNNRLEI